MKRTWFAILFLLLVAGLCIFEQHTVKTTFENMETLLQSMDAAAAEENYPEAERKARQLQNIWTARYPTLCVLMEHRALQEAGVTLGPAALGWGRKRRSAPYHSPVSNGTSRDLRQQQGNGGQHLLATQKRTI